jgi:hypothetical protein
MSDAPVMAALSLAVVGAIAIARSVLSIRVFSRAAVHLSHEGAWSNRRSPGSDQMMLVVGLPYDAVHERSSVG